MKKAGGRSSEANYIGEWFGHIVWPPEEVDDSDIAVKHQSGELCPFMSDALGVEVLCSKIQSRDEDEKLAFRTGFCTQSSTSNGPRQDWLACPSRVFDSQHLLIKVAVRRLYGVAPEQPITVDPITSFSFSNFLTVRRDQLSAKEVRVFAFSSNPPALGGEVSIPESDVAAASKVDVSIVELLLDDRTGETYLGLSAIFEIQTADFHGSPKHAIKELRRLGPPTRTTDYHASIRDNPALVGKDVEGPNKANIFKRMIYQMLVKMQMATAAPECAGCCVVLPLAVWDSWARHLGAPELIPHEEENDYVLLRDDATSAPTTSWIIIFDIERKSVLSPRPLKIVRTIATDPATLSRLAFLVAPQRGVEQGAMKKFHDGLARRLELAQQGAMVAVGELPNLEYGSRTFPKRPGRKPKP